MNRTHPLVERENTRVLITLLPAKSQGPTTYFLGGGETTAEFSSLALLDLLPNMPAKVVALCTEEAARDAWPDFKESARSRHEHLDSHLVQLSKASVSEDIDGFLKQVVSAVGEHAPAKLTVDVTQGFRHLSFLTYVATLYLQSLREIEVEGAWYGLWRRGHERHPFLDLKPLLELPRWIHALDVLGEAGSALPLACLLNEIPNDQNADRIGRDLERISEAYGSGLSLELGDQAFRFLRQNPKSMRKLLRNRGVPLSHDLVSQLKHLLLPFRLLEEPNGDGWKRGVSLTKAELVRQVRIIDDHLDRELRATALGMMNEWTVSWVIWRRASEEGDWLDYSTTRRSAAALLGTLGELIEDADLAATLTERQRQIAAFWRKLSDLRNAFSHHGMRGEDLVSSGTVDQKYLEVKKLWRELRTVPDWDLELSTSEETILVSPVGNRPGVLFTALKHCAARALGLHRCIIICSEESHSFIDEAIAHAGFKNLVVEPLMLADPFGGIDEFCDLAAEAKRSLARADEVYVNVTGGTTVMGLLAQQLADLARSFQRPVRRFGLIDRRDPTEQRDDPYKVGEVLWLDADSSTTDSGA